MFADIPAQKVSEVTIIHETVGDSYRAYGIVGERASLTEEWEVLGLMVMAFVDRPHDIASDRSEHSTPLHLRSLMPYGEMIAVSATISP
jgi:hypothetical protein